MKSWCWHNWSRWKALKEGPLVECDKDGIAYEVGYYITQQRECSRCGRIELRDASA